MKLLITGGDGFIAKSLAHGLDPCFEVVSANKKILDLRDAAAVAAYVKANAFDVVIHTATYDAAPVFSTKDPDKVLENNLHMFFNLARCRKYFGKLLYFGSGAEFSKPHWKPRMGEDYFDAYVPEDQYGLSKYIMNQYARSNQQIYNLRLFGVFGPYDDWRYRFIPNACCQALLDLPITIDRNGVYDFLFIDDLVQIVQWFIVNEPRRSDYNICTGRAYAFNILAEKIIAISGKKLEVRLKQNRPGIEYSGDNAKLIDEMGGFAFTPINQAIEKLYRWYEGHMDQIEKEKIAWR